VYLQQLSYKLIGGPCIASKWCDENASIFTSFSLIIVPLASK
jgi:hypothetical protein